MGFFSNLIKKEAQKLVSDVMDNSVGNIIKKNIPGSGVSSADESSVNRTYSYDRNTDISEDGVRERLEQVFATEWSDYEIRRNIPSSELNADSKARSYSYGMYRDGQPKAMIMLLTNRNHYCRKDVRLAHDACYNIGIPCINIMSYLPSTTEYISGRLKENLK